MCSFLRLFLVHAVYRAAAFAHSDSQSTVSKFKDQRIFEEAKREAYKDTQSALHSFEQLIKETFTSSIDETPLISSKISQNIIHQDQKRSENNKDSDWSGLDDLPPCSNKTKANFSMCIESETWDNDYSNGTLRISNTAKRKQRPTRELEPSLIRERRYSEKFKKYMETLPSALRVKLSKIPEKSHAKIESLPPAHQKKFFQKLVTHKKEKIHKKKKVVALDFESQVYVNRLHGFKNQLDEQKKRIKSRKKFYRQLDKYHNCTKKKEKWYKRPWETLKLYYRAAGQHVRLPCNLCIRPDERVEDYNLRWMRRASDDTQLEKLDVLSANDPDKDKEDSRFSWKDKGILFISELQVGDTGQYICINDNEYEAVHMLEVVPREPTKQVVGKMMQKEGKGELPMETQNLTQHNLQVFTLWEKWSPCSRCSARGTKKRHGTCYVKKLDSEKPVKPKDAQIFNYFPYGIACHSNFLPGYIQNIKELLSRKSESELNYCFVECPAPPKKKVIKGADGKKVEVIQSSKGYKKFKKKVDKFPHLVRRKTIYVQEGGKAQVTCVRKIKPASLVRWQKNYKILDPVELPKITNKRMIITATHRLLMSDVVKSDKGIYSCWVNGVLRKTTKVKVYTAQRAGIKDKIVYIGVGLSVIVIVLIVTQIGKNRKKGRKA